jgi:hypothetical protein
MEEVRHISSQLWRASWTVAVQPISALAILCWSPISAFHYLASKSSSSDQSRLVWTAKCENKARSDIWTILHPL